MNTETIMNLWADYMAAQNCKGRTIRERRIFVRSLVRHGGKELLDMNRFDLIGFLGRSDLTGRTKQNYRSTLHTLFTWMQDEGIRPDNPAARLPRQRVEPREPNPATTKDIQRVLDSGIYGHTVMKVLLYTYQGMRASEIAAVGGEAIDWDRRRILTVEGKGGKVVWRPLHPIVWERAQLYPRTGWWFPGLIPGEHVRGKSVSNCLCEALRRAGISHRAHDFRAWFATEMLEAKVDSKVVQHAMRHGDGQSIDKYWQPSEQLLRDAVEQLPNVVVPIAPARMRRQAANEPMAA